MKATTYIEAGIVASLLTTVAVLSFQPEPTLRLDPTNSVEETTVTSVPVEVTTTPPTSVVLVEAAPPVSVPIDQRVGALEVRVSAVEASIPTTTVYTGPPLVPAPTTTAVPPTESSPVVTAPPETIPTPVSPSTTTTTTIQEKE